MTSSYMPPDDPPGGYDIGAAKQAEKDSAWQWLQRRGVIDPERGYRYDPKNTGAGDLAAQAVFRAMPHTRTGKKHSWADIREEVLYLSGNDSGRAEQAVAEAKQVYDQINLTGGVYGKPVR